MYKSPSLCEKHISNSKHKMGLQYILTFCVFYFIFHVMLIRRVRIVVPMMLDMDDHEGELY